jgi:surfeit locus 1 family protein
VTVEGLAIPVERLPRTARTRVQRLAADEPDLLPLIVQANAAEPPLTPVPPPDLDDEGPHLSYAVQWFLFAGVAAVGYPILLHRRAGDDDGDDGDDGD